MRATIIPQPSMIFHKLPNAHFKQKKPGREKHPASFNTHRKFPLLYGLTLFDNHSQKP